MKYRFLAPVAALLWCLAGCGGSGSSSPDTVANATFRIAWPQRTRDAITTPLTSAQSARITFPKASANQTDVVVDVDRDPAKLDAYEGVYTVPQPVRRDLVMMMATFYSNASQSGTVVGTAAGTATLTSGSVEVGSVVMNGTVRSVSVVPPGTIDIKSDPVQLQFSATDSANQAVAISTGSAKWTLASGTAGTLTADGIFTPTSVGSVQVTVAVDGITSSSSTFSVTDETAPKTLIVAVPTNDLTWDPTRNCLWGTVQKSGGTLANTIVPIDPVTGTTGTAISTAIEPNLIAITDDGKYAYITSTEDQKVRRINLSTGTIEKTIVVNQTYIQLRAVPGSPMSFVGATDPMMGVNISVWDDTVRRTGTGAGGSCIRFGASAARLYGVGGVQLFRNTLTSTAITWNDQTNGLVNGDFEYSKGLIYTVNGEIANPETLQSVGQLRTADLYTDRRMTLSDSDDRVYMVTWNGGGKRVLTFDKTHQTELKPYDTTVTEGGAMHLVPAGPHAIAFHLYGSVTRKVIIVQNLP